MSVNRGGIAPFVMPRGMSSSAIDKRPVDGPVDVGVTGVAGDEQFERRFHGGPRKAVYLYASEDLEWWSEQLGRTIAPGFIGENITTSGIDLNGLFPGDELHLPSLRLEVTEPRDPCSKLAARVGVRGFERRFARSGRTGIYCGVICIGSVRAGDSLRAIAGMRAGPSIRALTAAAYGGTT